MLDRYIVYLKGTVSRLSSSFCRFYHLHFLNDLNVPDISTWKYVDDSTIAEIAPLGEVSHAQSAVDTMPNWSRVNMMQLNAASKCKELLIDFKRSPHTFIPVSVCCSDLCAVNYAKILGLTIVIKRS